MSDLFDRILEAVATAAIERFTSTTETTAPIEVSESPGVGFRASLDTLRARIAAPDAGARQAAVAEVDAALRALYTLLHPTDDYTDAVRWDIKAVRRRALRKRSK